MIKFDYTPKYLERLSESTQRKKGDNCRIPVPHTEVIDCFTKALTAMGMTVGHTSLSLTPDKLDMVCSFEITASEYVAFDDPKDTLWVGIVHGNSGHRASRVYGGTSNKSETIVMYQSRKLPKRFQGFKLKVKEEIERFAALALEFPRKLSNLKAKELSDTKVDRVGARAAKKGMISYTKLKRLYGEKDDIRGNARFISAYGLCQAFAIVATKKVAICLSPRTDALQHLYEFYEMVADKE